MACLLLVIQLYNFFGICRTNIVAMSIHLSTSSNDSVSSQASELHGSVDRLSAVFDTSVSLQSSQGSPSMARKSRQTHCLNSPTRLRSSSCPAAIERIHVLDPDHMWLPPHFQYYINATLADEQPSARLRFPGNGVVLLGDFSFSSIPEAEEEEEPSMSITELYNRNHRG